MVYGLGIKLRVQLLGFGFRASGIGSRVSGLVSEFFTWGMRMARLGGAPPSGFLGMVESVLQWNQPQRERWNRPQRQLPCATAIHPRQWLQLQWIQANSSKLNGFRGLAFGVTPLLHLGDAHG
jgi:hypothetical protein